MNDPHAAHSPQQLMIAIAPSVRKLHSRENSVGKLINVISKFTVAAVT